MSDRGVVRGTRRRRSISESGHPRLNSTILDSDLVFDGHALIDTRNNVIHRSQPIIGDETGSFIESPMGVGISTRLQARRLPDNSDRELLITNKLDSLKGEISQWQSIIDYKLITVDSIKIDHKKFKEDIQSLYQESIYAHVPGKLSYEIIGLISLIDRVKNAAHRFIRNEERMAETARINSVIASNSKQKLSQSGPLPSDNNSVIIAGGCSGYDNSTDVISHISTETVTAALQLQQARNDQPINSDIPRSAICDCPVTNTLLGAQSSEQSLPVTTQHDLTLTTNSFNSSSVGGGVILGDVRGARLAI